MPPAPEPAPRAPAPRAVPAPESEADAGVAALDGGAAPADVDAGAARELRRDAGRSRGIADAGARAAARSAYEIVDEAQRALASSPARALELAEEHRRGHGDGEWAEEREVVAIDALLRLGRTEEARARAAAFHARWPRSSLGRRVDVLVAP
jgi:hypothetical protein